MCVKVTDVRGALKTMIFQGDQTPVGLDQREHGHPGELADPQPASGARFKFQSTSFTFSGAGYSRETSSVRLEGMKLSGKVALVTGGSQGIGQAVAVRLAQEGADVVFNFHSHPEGAEDTKSKIESLGRRALAAQADLTKAADISCLVAAALEHFGRIDLLVNNAGIEMKAPFWEVTEEDYDQVQSVNMKAVFFGTQAVVRHWRENGQRGKIINISSVHEDLAFPGFSPYIVSKGGLRMFTRSLAVELAPLGITINNVAPGAIETPINRDLMNDETKLKPLLFQIPLGRIGKPEDVAGAVVYLASEDGDYVTGSTLFVDGGLIRNYHEQ